MQDSCEKSGMGWVDEAHGELWLGEKGGTDAQTNKLRLNAQRCLPTAHQIF